MFNTILTLPSVLFVYDLFYFFSFSTSTPEAFYKNFLGTKRYKPRGSNPTPSACEAEVIATSYHDDLECLFLNLVSDIFYSSRTKIKTM